jgi:hypothetical protein
MKKIIVCLLFLLPVLLFGQSEISTSVPSNITAVSATCGGTPDLCAVCTLHVKGVCWSTSPFPTIYDAYTDDGNAHVTYTSQLTGLAPGTLYYVRAYATYSNVWETLTIYGNTYTFTTLVPEVQTDAATAITDSSATSGGNITNDHGATVTYRGVCWDTTSDPTISDSYTVDGAGAGAFISNITGLTSSTLYYVRAYAYYGTGTSYGDVVTFSTTGLIPTVTTSAVDPASITSTSAVGGGEVHSDGGEVVTARGVCWSTSSDPTTSDSHSTDGTGTGSFTSTMTALSPGTQYFVRAYATNSEGTAYGNQVNFTTLPNPPTVTTSPVTIINSDSVSCGGTITDDGGSAITARGVCWGTSPNPTAAGPNPDGGVTNDGTGSGEFASHVSGLTAGAFYYIRAYAVNSGGTAYGNNLTFTTTPDLPTVTTAPVTNVTSSSADGGGEVTADGGAEVTARGVCWNTSPSPTESDTHTTNGTGTGSFTSSLANLSPDTTYYLRAYAVNSSGTAYGLEVVFTTGGANPAVTTSPVTMTGSTTASGGGEVTFEGASPVTSRGVCWNRATDPDLTNSHTSDGSGTGVFTSSLTGLIPGAVYYVRAYAVNDHGTNYGSNVTFTVPTTTPVVTTADITTVTSATASGGGNVVNEGGASVTTRGVCWNTSGTPTVSDNSTTDGTGRGAFTSFITGLAPLTTYYVRAYAVNSNGTGYGDTVSFTTTDTPDAPLVTTQPVTEIRIDSAVCGGIVRDEGKSPVTSRGVAWSASSGDPTPQFQTSDGVGIGPFTSLLSGLSEGQTYYVKAYAVNTYGTSYGEEISFVPSAVIPTVTTAAVTVTSAVTAKGGGEVTDDGGTDITARGVCWNTTSAPVVSDNHTANGTGTGTFTSIITGLTEGVTYYLRAYAVNQKGTAYGSQEVFTPGDPIPQDSPQLSVSRTQMNFAVMLDGTQVETMTGSQRFFIVNTGGGTLEWSVNSSDNWINVSPASGTGDALVSVSINPTGLTVGENTGALTISAPGAEDSPQTVGIYLRAAAGSEDSPAFGSFDTPIDGSAVSGSIPVTGWAIDDVAVTVVSIYRDPVTGEGGSRVYIGDAVFVEGARPDLETSYPGYPNNSSAGWGYMMLTHFLPNGGNGTFTLHAEAVDTAGQKTLLGSKTIVCANALAVKPFGAIDTPTQGGSASGADFINNGWALTPQPNSIPTDGSTISVFVDGTVLGNPVYNRYREDIARLLPGYANSNGAGGYFYLDTVGFTTGVHTISWAVSDSAGNADGIGSRYFIVVNSGTSRSSASSYTAGRKVESPPPRSGVLSVRSGWRMGRESQPLVTPVRKKGVFYLRTRELEPLEVVPPLGTAYSAARMLVNGKRFPLPPGAGTDPQTGVFRWMPGPGFVGTYTFVLTGSKADGQMIIDRIVITVKPKFNYLPER